MEKIGRLLISIKTDLGTNMYAFDVYTVYEYDWSNIMAVEYTFAYTGTYSTMVVDSLTSEITNVRFEDFRTGTIYNSATELSIDLEGLLSEKIVSIFAKFDKRTGVKINEKSKTVCKNNN